MNQKPFRYAGDLLSVMNNATALPEEVALSDLHVSVDHHSKCFHHVRLWIRHPLSPESGHLRKRDHQQGGRE